MAFTAHYPYLVNYLILLGPGGILRDLPSDYKNNLLRYASFVPFNYLRLFVAKILGVSVATKAIEAPTRLGKVSTGMPQVAPKLGETTFDIPSVVQWQFDHHKGFCHSFVDTINYGPLMSQHSDWQRVCDIVTGKMVSTSKVDRENPLWNSKVILAIFGDTDDVVRAQYVSEDLLKMLGGPEHIEIKTVPGGHGFPVPSCDQVVKHIMDFWQL